MRCHQPGHGRARLRDLGRQVQQRGKAAVAQDQAVRRVIDSDAVADLIHGRLQAGGGEALTRARVQQAGAVPQQQRRRPGQQQQTQHDGAFDEAGAGSLPGLQLRGLLGTFGLGAVANPGHQAAYVVHQDLALVCQHEGQRRIPARRCARR